ncbi:MAG TPA: protein kinase [Longimicrobiales bacterium]|nr:protein kinase [Longimicrobiales bacterium]
MTDPILDRLTAALVGRYTIVRPLGEGGMATVYLAEDVKHKRQVALKVLKPELAAVVGADRFLTEIKTTANLSHPHILPLHDSGEADTFLFYVMPYVTGESLRDRLDRERQLPVDEAVRMIVALAGALEHAHKRGVIHRDIKPANILLQDGQPVMADFGIALAVGSAGGARLTETGLSVGTPYYMSPEQATGDQVIGPSSDIYALACVLYEMLTGEPPFPGATAQAVLGKIISGNVTPVTQARPQVPPNVDAALRCGLERLAADRFHAAEDFARALSDPGFRYGNETLVAETGGGRWKRVAMAASVAAVALGAIAGWALLRSEAPAPVSRYAVVLPEGHDIARTFGANVALSPDGSELVYVSADPGDVQDHLWLRRRDQLLPVPVVGTEGAFGPAFSPDGQRVAYLSGSSNTAVRVVSLGGEPPIEVTRQDVGGGGVTWGSDGNLYYDGQRGLWRVPPTGGEPTLFLEPDTARQETLLAWAQVLPNAKGLIVTVGHRPITDVTLYDIVAVDLATAERTTLVRGVFARYARSGHLVYTTADGTLLAVPFDQDAMKLTGSPVALAQGVGIGTFGSVDIDVADDGTLAYVTGGTTSGLARAVWVDWAGEVTVVDPDWEFDPGQPEVALEISPDGSRLAVKVDTEAGEDIWVKELDRGPLSRLTFYDGIDRRPRWSRDGTRIMYTSDRNGDYDVWEQPADGTGVAEVTLDLAQPVLEVQRTPDGEWFILRLGGVSGVTGVRDLVAVHRGDTVTTPVAAESYDEKAVALSPSGRWVAYESTETGQNEVYVRPFPNVNGGKWQVSTGGGINPKWGKDERELFYVNGRGEMTVARVQAGDGFRVGDRTPLFSLTDRALFSGANYAGWDVAPDGSRFLMVQLASEAEGVRHDLVIVENFFRELREKVGGR